VRLLKLKAMFCLKFKIRSLFTLGVCRVPIISFPVAVACFVECWSK